MSFNFFFQKKKFKKKSKIFPWKITHENCGLTVVGYTDYGLFSPWVVFRYVRNLVWHWTEQEISQLEKILRTKLIISRYFPIILKWGTSYGILIGDILTRFFEIDQIRCKIFLNVWLRQLEIENLSLFHHSYKISVLQLLFKSN